MKWGKPNENLSTKFENFTNKFSTKHCTTWLSFDLLKHHILKPDIKACFFLTVQSKIVFVDPLFLVLHSTNPMTISVPVNLLNPLQKPALLSLDQVVVK